MSSKGHKMKLVQGKPRGSRAGPLLKFSPSWGSHISFLLLKNSFRTSPDCLVVYHLYSY